MTVKISRRQFIKTSAQAGVFIGLSGNYLSGKERSYSGEFDLVIKNGLVVDGIKNEAYRADVGIGGDLIQAIGNLQNARAKSVIDASNRVISPGFIDIHSHTDQELYVNPKAESKIHQGVTTELGGNCGGSPFPGKEAASETGAQKSGSHELKTEWKNLEEYHSTLARKGIAVNHATLLGHGTLRAFVMGEDQRAPTQREMELMKALTAEAMEQGAFGLSTGLEYTPSGFAEPKEIIELCRISARYGGFYATHIRSEDSFVIESIAEAIYIAESAGLPLQISHLKASGEPNWWKLREMIDLIERANERGLAVNADRYPYTAYSTGLSVFFPKWARDGGPGRLAERLKDRGLREKMKEETERTVQANNSWKSILIVEVQNKENRHLEGKRIHKAAAERNQDPYEFACDLLVDEKGSVSIVGFGMSEANTETVLKHPLVMLCSDGSALAPYGPLSRGVPHPRNYGTFPRFIRLYVREKKALSLPEAVKKMTSMPAAKLGLKKRGVLKEGCFADVVVFDPDTIADKANYANPEQYPVGIDYVLVNGKVAVEHGTHTGTLAGQVLHGPGKKSA